MWFKYIFLFILIILCGGITICNAGPTLPRLVRRNVPELHIPVAIVADHVDDVDLNYNNNNDKQNKKIIHQNEENRENAVKNSIETIEAKDQTQTSLLIDNDNNDVTINNNNDNNNNNNNRKQNDKIISNDHNHNNNNDIVNDNNSGEIQNQIINENVDDRNRNRNRYHDRDNENLKNLPEIIEQKNDQEKAYEEAQQLKGEKINDVIVEEKIPEILTKSDKEMQQMVAANEMKSKLNEENRNDLNKEMVTDQGKIVTLDKVDDVINENKNENEKVEMAEVNEKDDVVLRQSALDNAAASTTTQANFVQQFIQNSPLGPLFNQFTGQQNVNDAGTTSAPPSPLQPFLNPIQSVVNSTTQAIQGFQQFANNLGQQFQNTLSNLGGQQQQASGDSTTQRPVGPIQQLVSNFIGAGQSSLNDQQQSQPQQQQGPLQTLFTNIFQGGQRPQNVNPPTGEVSSSSATSTTNAPAPIQPQIVEEDNDNDANKDRDPQNIVDNNQLRSSDEIDDSFEQNIKSDEQIVVDDDGNDNDQAETHTAANAIA